MPGILRLSNNTWAFLVVVFVLLSSWGNWQIIKAVHFTGSIGNSEGEVMVCVNTPPTISHSCTLTAIIGDVFECDMDAVQDSGESVTFYDYTDLFSINSSTGMIRFTPISSQAGSYLANISAADNSSCSNNENSTILNITVREAYCGDGTCRAGEDCSNCASDCGQCPTVVPPAEAEAPRGVSGGGGGGGVNIFDIDFSKVDEKIVAKYSGEKIIFTFNGITPHSANIKNVEEGYFVVSIDKGEDITVSLKEIKSIDMNGDGIDDVKFYYMEADENRKATIKGIKGPGAEGVAKDDALPIKIEPESIKILLKVGTSLEQTMTVRNTGSYDFNIILEQKALDSFIEISETEFAVRSYEKKGITLRFTASAGQQPGVYSGKIFVEAVPSPGRGQKIFRNIPATVEVESSELLFDATIDIPADYREVMPGQLVKAMVTIFNLKKVRPVEINVDYLIKDMYGNEIVREKDLLSVEEQVSYEKSIKIPDDAKEGDYLLIVQTRYGSSFSTTSQKFYVGKAEEKRVEETRKVVEQVQTKYNIALFIGVGVLALLSILMFIHYRKRIRRIEKESREKIVKRLEELERKYKKEFEKAEDFAREEEERLGLDRLADFIKEHMDKGYEKEHIREHLRRHGWKEHHIEHAMHKAHKRKAEEEIENLRRSLK